MSAYEIAVTITVICLIALSALVFWLLSFIFEKLNLPTISNFFNEIMYIPILVLITIGAVVIVLTVFFGFYLAATHIVNFIFALF